MIYSMFQKTLNVEDFSQKWTEFYIVSIKKIIEGNVKISEVLT